MSEQQATREPIAEVGRRMRSSAGLSRLEGANESASRAAADWQLILRVMQGLLGDDRWPSGRTIDGTAELGVGQDGEPVWHVGHQSYAVARREPEGAEEIIETGWGYVRRISRGVILKDRSVINSRAKPESPPQRRTERSSTDRIRRRRKRR